MIELTFPYDKIGRPIFIGNDIFGQISEQIYCYKSKILIIIDETVWNYWGNQLNQYWVKYNLDITVKKIQAIERNKTLSTIQEIMDFAIKSGISRSSLIIAIGGGIIGNIAGLVAGLLYRGVKLIHVPTTIVAMADSILSNKQAVNSALSKNSFGIYYTPEKCFIDTRLLETLPRLHINAGLVEIAKNILAFDPQNIDHFRNLISSNLDYNSFAEIVLLGIKQKAKLLEMDRFEKGPGLILEYGHTIGHALEYIMNIPHGIAVGLGMLVESEISRAKGWLSYEEFKIHRELIELCIGELAIESICNLEELKKTLFKDNKIGYLNGSSEEVPMVLLSGLGQPKYNHGIPLEMVHVREILNACQIVFPPK